jgi:hypothetical protein
MTMEMHRQSLDQAASQLVNETRMVLPGVQAILGFQLVAAFNQRFEEFTPGEQALHFAAFLLLALTMGLLMTPAAYHREAERRVVSARFIRLSSGLLTIAMVPFSAGVCIDTYLLGRMILKDAVPAMLAAAAVLLVLLGLWFVLPALARPRHR